jgi:hypothetical protein
MVAERHGAKVWPMRIGVLVSVLVSSLSSSCLVDQRCYQDRDCPAKEICSAAGVCAFECAVNGDCDAAFGLEFTCAEKHCQRAPTCTACSFAHAEHTCVHGDCQLVSCLPGYFDRDGDLVNGCELRCETGTLDANGNPDDGCECTPTNGGVEACNDIDDNCDGEIDEGFLLLTDVTNCGACNLTCTAGPHAVPICGGGRCRYVCESGFYDGDNQADNGCEHVECVPVVELCNGRDDDCDCLGDTNSDGTICSPGDEGVDEGFDKNTVELCGPYCNACSLPFGTSSCINGTCQLLRCDDGYVDLDNKSANGCEYACTPTGKESCNFLDDDCDGLVDEGEVCSASCPPDMVAVRSAYCIDRYEASRIDASASTQGTDTTLAVSRSGVLPWMVNPMTTAHLAEFEAACRAAGKHLCTKDEWIASCTGPNLTPFVYGNTFNREACNCIDTFCDDYCAENGLASCSTASDCGYSYDCYHEAATGSFPGCTNDYGTFDLNGNVWEIVPSTSDSRGYEIRGGAFNCANASTRVSCDFNANWTALYAGFRCCKAFE